MDLETIERKIEQDLKHFDEKPLREAATTLLNTLGYYSDRTGNDDLDNDRFMRLKAAAAETVDPKHKLRIHDWQSFHYVMQITDDEVNENRNYSNMFDSSIEHSKTESYLFVALKLTEDTYNRTTLSNITRFINTNINQENRENRLPVLVMFRYGAFLTLSVIDRRDSKIDKKKQVLEKVTLIKDINLNEPHTAHRRILTDILLEKLIETENVRNFDTLHKAWAAALDIEPLNKEFYKRLYDWYKWAITECSFPDNNNELQVIRLTTRLLFIWFLKENISCHQTFSMKIKFLHVSKTLIRKHRITTKLSCKTCSLLP